jgi:ABC-2 type transport system permease protein
MGLREQWCNAWERRELYPQEVEAACKQKAAQRPDNYAQDARFLDPGPLIGGYVFVAVSGLLFVSVGVLASSLSRSQAVAGVLAFALLFAIIVGTRLMSDLTVLQQEGFTRFRDTLENVQVMSHLQDFTRGIIDTRQIVFYLSGTALALIFSILGVEGKVLRS